MAEAREDFQVLGGDVMGHGGVEAAADVTDDVIADVVMASHKAQALNACHAGIVPNAAIARLERNKQRLLSVGGAAPATREDLVAYREKLKADLKAELTAELKAEFKAVFQTGFDQLSQQMSASNRNHFARLQNSLAGSGGPYLTLVRDKPPAEGSSAALGSEPSVDFPRNKDDLTTISGFNITALAEHYGEEFAGDTVVERREALARFIGVRW